MYLVDTNVVSEIRKIRIGRADVNVAAWADSVDAADLFLSVITIQELEIGVLQAERKDQMKGGLLRAWLNEQVLPAFDGRIISIDVSIAVRSAQLHVPNPGPFRDSLIAATAIVHRMAVVTRNVSDFVASGVITIDPWTDNPPAHQGN